MKTKSKEFQLKITPGAALICPRCRKHNSVRLYDGDSIPMCEVMPDAKVIAGGRALSKDRHSFSGDLNAGVCGYCGAKCYVVQVDVVDQPNITEDFADRYFCHNGEAEAPFVSFTVTCQGAGLPKRWTMEFTESGEIVSCCFGPFIPRTSLDGSNGVANCEGGRVWKDAADMIVKAWPLILSDRIWPESVTIKGRLPLRDVAGWKPGKRR